MDVDAKQLQEAERMHGGKAQLAQSVPVSETVQGRDLMGRRGSRL
jgi:hypothetical protein